MSSTTKTIILKSTAYLCDLCEKEVEAKYKCQICKIDICKKHTIYDPDDFTDFPYTYCEQCWNAGSEYRKKIKNLEKQIEKLTDQWHNKAIKLRNKSIPS